MAVNPAGEVFVGGSSYGSLDGEPNTGLNDAFVMKFVPAADVRPAAPTDALADPAMVCGGGSSRLSAMPGSGGDTIEWFTESCGGTAVPGGASPTVSPGVTTEYFARTRNSVSGATSETCATVTLTVSVPIAADLEGDCDVDWMDFTLFAACTSAAMAAPSPGCESSDLDGDNDVDQSDFGIFQRCYSGENIPADPNCAD